MDLTFTVTSGEYVELRLPLVIVAVHADRSNVNPLLFGLALVQLNSGLHSMFVCDDTLVTVYKMLFIK